MKDLIETTTELLTEVETLQSDRPDSRFLGAAHGGLKTAIDNFRHEAEARGKAEKAEKPKS